MTMNATQSPQDLLLTAGNMLEWHDSRDRQKPGLLELTGVSQHGRATMSGLNDHDYQSLAYLPSNDTHNLQQMRTVTKSGIPTEILEHFKHIKCHCTMGLFPEIGRAWLTIDSEIYIWTYDQARDVAYYDGLSHLIVSVGLVKPKSGVFVNDVKYLLILTTPIEVIVLGVTFGDDSTECKASSRLEQEQQNAMMLMNRPIFVIATDNISIGVIKGTEDGRIFLGGRDGCLYEIHYQAESSWFGKRCKKINLSQGIVSCMVPSFLKVFSEVDPIERIAVDNSRKLLYLLTERGSIEAWEMGKDYIQTRRLGKVTQNDIVSQCVNLIKTVDPSIFKCVKAICALSVDDANGLHLVAVTQSGVRLYFSTTSLNLPQQASAYMQADNCGVPQSGLTPPPMGDFESTRGLYLLHVRLPPGYTPNATTNKPKQVHAAHYSEGTTLMVTTQQQEQDLLWSISSAPFMNFNYLSESTALAGLDGIVWGLAEVHDSLRSGYKSLLYNARTPRKLALLTNQGTHIIELLKAADILHQLMLACNGPHHEEVKMFFQPQNAREACATALLLATSEKFRGGDIAMWATQAFMLYGGEPGFQHQKFHHNVTNRNLPNQTLGANSTVVGRDSTMPPIYMSTPMPNSAGPASPTAYPPVTSLYSQPISPIAQGSVPPNVTASAAMANENSSIIFSAKHDGLYLFVSRMLRPIWHLRCVDQSFHSNLKLNDCTQLLLELRSLRNFLELHSVHDLSSSTTTRLPYDSHFSNLAMSNSHLPLNEQRNITELAQTEEKRSLSALNIFVKHACEVISLWSILTKHKFQQLCQQLSAEHQKLLECCSFRDLLLTRSEVCAFLIISLINFYLKDKASVCEVSNNLRELCPNLYRHEDEVTYKATELLMNAKNCTSSVDKETMLRTTLQMCKNAAPTLPLHSICQQFISAEFYEGVIELAATCASKSDPEEVGIHFYNNNEPSEDREGYACFATRMNYYKEVQLMLDHVYEIFCNRKTVQDNMKSDITDHVGNVNQAIPKISMQALRVKDPLMHVTLYEWLLSHDMLSELLDVIEPSLGDFLRRSVNRNPENVVLIDLLWKYYEKNAHHAQAAQILDNLAMTRSDNISLELRIEYLVRAVMCMRNENVGSSITNGIFQKELEDKLEIARVQKTVLIDMTALAHNPQNANMQEASQAVKQLNFALYDITQLYQHFAEPFNLWECQLSILNCSHHNDPLLIESVWGNIINSVVDCPGSAHERSVKLFSKIELLVREFGESGACFPFAFLIRELEIKACQLRLPEGTVPEKLVAMNLDVELLLEYYSRMISMNERIWANEGNEWHLIQSAVRVVTLLVDNVQAIWFRSKRRIIGKAQDIVGACLNICYQKPDSNRLQHSLKELQCRLQRLLG
ncbi:nuclear pore complex protein Nup154 [Drosophila tropicalis]|uniref:nuclear pore complex protein Nup154 n=1 Tax=Drosophila tropicalis TaxID=46794 RepID=UPI0035ABD78C